MKRPWVCCMQMILLSNNVATRDDNRGNIHSIKLWVESWGCGEIVFTASSYNVDAS